MTTDGVDDAQAERRRGGRRRRRSRSLLVAVGRWERSRHADEQNAGIARVRAAVGPLDSPDSRRRSGSSRRFQCLLYSTRPQRFALELCVDRNGRVVEAIDRRSGRAEVSGACARTRARSKVPRRPRGGRAAICSCARRASAASSAHEHGRFVTGERLRRCSSRARFRSLIAGSSSVRARRRATSPWNIPVGRTLRWAVLAELLACSRFAYAFGLAPRAVSRPDGSSLLLGVLLRPRALSLRRWSVDPTLTLGRARRCGPRSRSLPSLLAVGARRELDVEADPAGAPRRAVTRRGRVGRARALVRPRLGDSCPRRPAAARYNGIGGNPNTMAMLIALVLPLVAGRLAEARARAPEGRRRLAVPCSLDGSLVASGSRGALVAGLGRRARALAAALAPARRARRARRRLWPSRCAAVAVRAIAGAAAGGSRTRSSRRHSCRLDAAAQSARRTAEPAARERDRLAEARRGAAAHAALLRLERPRAMRGAERSTRRSTRPLLGYGFGTEERVFVDRYYLHYSDRAENAYLGTLLQLGLVGLALLLAALVAALAAASDGSGRRHSRGVRRRGRLRARARGQPVVPDLGRKPATVPFWFAALLLVGARSRRRRTVSASVRVANAR